MTLQQPTRATDIELIKVCAKKSIQLVRPAPLKINLNYCGADGLFPMISAAIDRAKTPKHKEAILNTLDSLEAAAASSTEEMKQLILKSVYQSDPGLFFDFCRTTELSISKAKGLLKKIEKSLNRSYFNRAEVVALVSKYVVRRLMGDYSARTPLLYGPPGGGKSELATQLASALTSAGVAATPLFQVMSQQATPQDSNDAGMRLMGTSRHYSNGSPGDLYQKVSKPEIDLGLVLLDEADKCTQRDYMVSLLDPKTPLQDEFMREVIHSIDLRRKSLMLLTANDPSKLNHGDDDPLWSRLEPVYLQNYSRKEMIGVAVEVVCGPQGNPYHLSRARVRKIATQTMNELGDKASFRAVLDHINDKLFHQALDIEYPAKSVTHKPAYLQRRPIGFRGSNNEQPQKVLAKSV